MRCLCGGIANKEIRRRPVIFGKSVVILETEAWVCQNTTCRFEFGDIETAGAIQRKLLGIMEKYGLQKGDLTVIKGGNRRPGNTPLRDLIKEIKDGKE